MRFSRDTYMNQPNRSIESEKEWDELYIPNKVWSDRMKPREAPIPAIETEID